MSAGAVRIWGWPLAIALACASGLVSALLADGWGDAWAWLGLGWPVAISGWHAWPRANRSRTTDPS